MRELGLLLAGAGRDNEAERWLRRPAEDGDSRAMPALAKVLQRSAGEGEGEGERWLRDHAAQGDSKAMCLLAELLARGRRRRSRAVAAPRG
jgi:hypothetical protein